jgi:hypothetical protein
LPTEGKEAEQEADGWGLWVREEEDREREVAGWRRRVREAEQQLQAELSRRQRGERTGWGRRRLQDSCLACGPLI